MKQEDVWLLLLGWGEGGGAGENGKEVGHCQERGEMKSAFWRTLREGILSLLSSV